MQLFRSSRWPMMLLHSCQIPASLYDLFWSIIPGTRCSISWFEFGRKESLQLWPIKVGVGWPVLCRGTITDHSNQDWSGGSCIHSTALALFVQRGEKRLNIRRSLPARLGTGFKGVHMKAYYGMNYQPCKISAFIIHSIGRTTEPGIYKSSPALLAVCF